MSPEELRILRKHWEWSGRYAMLWIIVTIIIFGGAFVMLDIVGVAERVQTPSFILLLAITTVNAIWRAAGVLAARIEVMLVTKRTA
jgi:hypothetical protein